MSETYGCQSMVLPLRRVIVKRPDQAFADADPGVWHYAGKPDLERAVREHESFCDILRAAGAEVIYHDEAQPGRADAIYVHDPALVTDKGAVTLRMGKELRRGEEDALERSLRRLRVPILYTMHSEAVAEGGDLLWLNGETLAAGVGFRTNADGIIQLEEALEPLGVEVVPVSLPYHGGPEACLHLMSLISMLDADLAVAYLPLLPVVFAEYLRELGIEIVPIPDEEFLTMGPNVLALAPRHCLMLEGNPITKGLLEGAGCRVETYRGDEISHKAEGGPTCLTRPILRRH